MSLCRVQVVIFSFDDTQIQKHADAGAAAENRQAALFVEKKQGHEQLVRSCTQDRIL